MWGVRPFADMNDKLPPNLRDSLDDYKWVLEKVNRYFRGLQQPITGRA